MWSAAIEQSGGELFSANYDDLIALARAIRRQNKLSNTLMTDDLLHEAFLKLGHTTRFDSLQHFKACVAVAMRHVSIDRARKRLAQKRGGDLIRIHADDDDDHIFASPDQAEQTLAVGMALERLREASPRQAGVFDCRYFAGFTAAETAEIMNVTEKTVQRDWDAARQWLRSELGTP